MFIFDVYKTCLHTSSLTSQPLLYYSASKNALVIGADALTRWVDWDDRNSCILFGDGAGAMVLSGSKDENGETQDDGFGILGYSMHSNGGGYNDLKCM